MAQAGWNPNERHQRPVRRQGEPGGARGASGTSGEGGGGFDKAPGFDARVGDVANLKYPSSPNVNETGGSTFGRNKERLIWAGSWAAVLIVLLLGEAETSGETLPLWKWLWESATGRVGLVVAAGAILVGFAGLAGGSRKKNVDASDWQAGSMLAALWSVALWPAGWWWAAISTAPLLALVALQPNHLSLKRSTKQLLLAGAGASGAAIMGGAPIVGNGAGHWPLAVGLAFLVCYCWGALENKPAGKTATGLALLAVFVAWGLVDGQTESLGEPVTPPYNVGWLWSVGAAVFAVAAHFTSTMSLRDEYAAPKNLPKTRPPKLQ